MSIRQREDSDSGRLGVPGLVTVLSRRSEGEVAS
jgi:hypothetical protein